MAVLTYLIDSNAIIDYIGENFSPQTEAWIDTLVDAQMAASTINKMEVLGFNFPNSDDSIPFEDFFKTVTILPLFDEIETKTIEIRRKMKIKLPDAIIAATALVHDLTLISRNLKDFNRIDNLVVIDPFAM
jgi:predicted nucleic acid-binding protein